MGSDVVGFQGLGVGGDDYHPGGVSDLETGFPGFGGILRHPELLLKIRL